MYLFNNKSNYISQTNPHMQMQEQLNFFVESSDMTLISDFCPMARFKLSRSASDCLSGTYVEFTVWDQKERRVEKLPRQLGLLCFRYIASQ